MENLDKTFLKRLAEVGFLATMHNDSFKEAGTIFSALQKVRPRKAATLIGSAVVAINSGHFDKAIEYLTNTKPEDPADADKVNVFLAMAYQGAGRDDERLALLQKIAAEGEPEAKKLAEELLAQPSA